MCATLAWTGPARALAAAPAALFDADQLDNLLAPIALYPDPLLAQVLPAATFVDEVDSAARWLRAGNDKNKIDSQNWDVAVKAVAHYPSVTYKMADDLDWTAAVGQAYVEQSTDVMTSIQRLRARARSAGTLVSNAEQKVVVDGSYITIVPAQPQVIYVPTYNPQVVYVQQSSGPSTGTVVAATAIAFGAGLAMGAWLNNDCDWHHGNVYYHGWTGGGWVGASRTYVNVNNNYYVNRSYTNVNVNRNVVNRNVNYNNINRYNSVNKNVNYNNVNVNRNNVNNVNRNNVNANNVNRNNVNNSTLNKNINANDARVDAYRGRTANQSGGGGGRQNAGTADTRQTGQKGAFEGYKPRGEANADASRGRASREQMAPANKGGGRQNQNAQPGAKAGGRGEGAGKAKPESQQRGGGGGRKRP